MKENITCISIKKNCRVCIQYQGESAIKSNASNKNGKIFLSEWMKMPAYTYIGDDHQITSFLGYRDQRGR